MKNIEKLAIVLILLWLGGYLCLLNPQASSITFDVFVDRVTQKIISSGDLSSNIEDMNLVTKVTLSMQPILLMTDRIFLSIWLFFKASEDKKSRWIWTILGLSFGISTLILYFLKQIVDRDKVEN